MKDVNTQISGKYLSYLQTGLTALHKLESRHTGPDQNRCLLYSQKCNAQPKGQQLFSWMWPICFLSAVAPLLLHSM